MSAYYDIRMVELLQEIRTVLKEIRDDQKVALTKDPKEGDVGSLD